MRLTIFIITTFLFTSCEDNSKDKEQYGSQEIAPPGDSLVNQEENSGLSAELENLVEDMIYKVEVADSNAYPIGMFYLRVKGFEKDTFIEIFNSPSYSPDYFEYYTIINNRLICLVDEVKLLSDELTYHQLLQSVPKEFQVYSESGGNTWSYDPYVRRYKYSVTSPSKFTLYREGLLHNEWDDDGYPVFP